MARAAYAVLFVGRLMNFLLLLRIQCALALFLFCIIRNETALLAFQGEAGTNRQDQRLTKLTALKKQELENIFELNIRQLELACGLTKREVGKLNVASKKVIAETMKQWDAEVVQNIAMFVFPEGRD